MAAERGEFREAYAAEEHEEVVETVLEPAQEDVSYLNQDQLWMRERYGVSRSDLLQLAQAGKWKTVRAAVAATASPPSALDFLSLLVTAAQVGTASQFSWALQTLRDVHGMTLACLSVHAATVCSCGCDRLQLWLRRHSGWPFGGHCRLSLFCCHGGCCRGSPP